MAFRFHRWSCGLAVWLGCLTLWTGLSAAGASFSRSIPEHFTRGVPFEVVIEAVPDPDAAVYAVEDHVPPGWTAGVPSHGGVWDPVQGAVKWGPFIGSPAVPRVLTYQVHPPSDAALEAVWTGEVAWNGTGSPIGGRDQSRRFPGELIRRWPADYLPGVRSVVTLTARPAADVQVYAVEEWVPAGWTVTSVSHGGEFDAQNRRIKWGPFLDEPAFVRELTFEATPPADAVGDASFHARAWFDAAEVLQSGVLPRRSSRATAGFAAEYSPEVAAPLEIRLGPAPFVRVQVAELRVPDGWNVAFPSHGGVLDPVTRKLKWGPFTDLEPQSRTLTAQLTPPAGADGDVVLAGLATFDTETVVLRMESTRHRLHDGSRVVRDLPAEFDLGTVVTIELAVVPRDGTPVYTVEDTLPAGWVLDSLEGGGVYDALNRKVKWGPFFGADGVERLLRYRAVPGPAAGSEARFQGVGWFGDVFRDIDGDQISRAPEGRAERIAPARYTPGSALTVRINAIPGPGTEAYAVEDLLPEGWSFQGAVEGGVFDPVNRRIKWGPFSDRNRRTLSYQATPPPEASGTVPLSGTAAFNRNLLGVTGSIHAVENGLPIAVSNSVQRLPGQMLKISAIQLLTDDADPDGDPLRVTGVSSASVHGATVTLAWPWIFYLPPPGYDGPDRFTYQVGDAFGGTASTGVDVVVVPPSTSAQNIMSALMLPDGSRQIRFGGVPGYTYHVEASVNLTDWLRLDDRTASALGQFEFVDTEAASFPIRYYRSTWP